MGSHSVDCHQLSYPLSVLTQQILNTYEHLEQNETGTGLTKSVYRRSPSWKALVRIPEMQDFNRIHSVKNDTGAHSSSDGYPWLKRQGHEADHSSPCSVEIKHGGAIPTLSHASSWNSA
jgi:hypothetical protein